MIYLDHLRPPGPLDPWPAGYKDWLHLNILDHATGSIGLVNVSLHGAPTDPRARAIGTALVHVPESGWLGNMELRSFGEAALGRTSIGLERVALALQPPAGELMASVRDPASGVTLSLNAVAAAPPIIVEEPLPLGRGWISWYALPRLTVAGEWTIGAQRSKLQGASAYHDHNWGRWHWGDDFGWEWGCFLTPAPGPAFVFARTTDRAHRHLRLPSLHVYAADKRRAFSGSAIKVGYSGLLAGISRRVPGALAALHQDRAHLRLPQRLTLSANDGFDWVQLEFTGRAAAQLIAGDPIARGYSFIHEIAGAFTCAGRLGGLKTSGEGLGVLEYVC